MLPRLPEVAVEPELTVATFCVVENRTTLDEHAYKPVLLKTQNPSGSRPCTSWMSAFT